MSLPQPPEGILDPKQPWYLGKVSEKTWVILKARLTGGEAFGTGYSTFVRLTSTDADKLIENLKKDPRGYPQINQTGGAGGFENLQKYQEWLREDYLEKPFNKERDAKIEEAAIESRMREIDAERQQNKIKELEEQAKKDKESIPLPPIQEEKKEQDILDSDQEAIEEQVEEITTGLDSVQEEEKKAETPKQTPEQDSSKLDSDIQAISDSLLTIKGSLSNQISDLGSIERDSIKSLSALEGLKQLFQTQTDIIKRELDTSESKERQDSLEKSNVVSGTDEATSTTADNKAEGIIEGVDGPTITVKTTEGEFRQGQKISQGGGGGGLFDMLKGIAGKFMGGGKGGGGGAGGGSPLKMSRGGIAVGPTKLAGGAFSPGIYSKPTRGNLGPGQAVVPLNRNIGKKMFPDQLKQTIKLQQPLADVMAQPLKAIGLSILSVAGNFLRLLGPLAGFFTPYVSGLVKGFAAVLGVPVAIVGALLGGPAYAAMEDQERQQNVFAELWASLMEKFGFSSGGGDGEGKKKKKNGERDVNTDGPTLTGPMAEKGKQFAKHLMSKHGLKDFQAAAIVGVMMREGFGSGKPDVREGGKRGAPTYDGTSKEGYGWIQWTNTQGGGPNDRLNRALIHLGMGPPNKTRPWTDADNISVMEYEWAKHYTKTIPAVKSATSLEQAVYEFVGNYTAGSHSNISTYQNREDKSGGGFIGRRNSSAASVLKGLRSETSAESGITTSDSSMGKMLGWSVVKGPNSGYDVDPTLEMHGEEAYLQYEKGFTILPIENNQFSLSKKPKETLTRWQELMNPGRASLEDSGEKTFAARGTRKKYKSSSDGKMYKNYNDALAAKNSRTNGLGIMQGLMRTYKAGGGNAATAQGGNLLDVMKQGSTNLQAQQKPITPLLKKSESVKQSKDTAPKQLSETDLMMEQYDQLVAAGKQSEAKELGMKIWNKTWRKTEKGIERIPTTPITATNATLPTASASSPTAVSSPQQIVVPVPASGGVTPAIVPFRTIQEDIKWITLKNLC